MGGRQVGRQVWLLLVLALFPAMLVAAAAAGCGNTASSGASSASSGTPKQGGTYNYPLAIAPGPFDPGGLQMDGQAVLHQVYEGLVRYEQQPDGSMKTAPCLAESWGANADATVWTVRLRRGVMFQAPVSREVTAADVVADLRYIADPARKSPIAYMLVGIAGTDPSGWAKRQRLGVKALDRYTVRFDLKYSYSEFPDTLGAQAFWVWPADYMRKTGLKAYEQHPVGTGAYMFLRMERGKSVDLVRNPHWWDSTGGPYIDNVHFEVFSNVTSMMLAFQKGQIDWTSVPQGQIAASRSLPQVKSGEWTTISTPDLALGYLFVNMNDPVVGGTQGLPLRQALTYGCERQAAIDAASDGADLLPDGLIPPGVPGSRDVAEPYGYDPAKAKELIDGRGPVTLQLIYPVERFAQTIAETLTASYAKIGITLKPKGVEFTKLQKRLAAGKSQVFLAGWIADYPSMDNFLYPLFQSSSSASGSYTFYSNPDVDTLLAKARATPEQAARVQLYENAERKILADAPAVPLVVYADFRLMNNRVANVRFNSMVWVDLWRAWVK